MLEDFKWQIATQRTVWFTCTHSPPVTFIPKVRSGDVPDEDEDQRNSHQTFLRLSQHTGTCTLAAVYCACWFLTKLSNEVTACVQRWRNMSAAIWRGKLHLSECWTRLGSSHIPSVNAVPHGGQMEGLWGKGRGLELYAEPCVLPVNAVPHGGQMESLWGRTWGLELSVEPSIPPVNTLSHGGQIEGLWGKGRGLELYAEPCVLPVNAVPHGGQMESLWGKRWGLELNAEPSIPPVKTVSHGSQMESLWGKRWGLELNAEPSIPPVKTVSHGSQMESLWGKRWGLELNAEPSIPPVKTVSHGSQMESLWGKRWGLELNAEPSIPPVKTVSHGSQMESLWGKRWGLELNAEPSIPPVKTVSHGSQMESLWGRRLGLELSTKPSTTRRFINQHWREANGTLRSAKDTKAHPQNPATWHLHKDNLVLKPGNIRSQNLREEKDQFHLLFSAIKCAISCPRSLLLARSWTAPGQAGISMAEYRLTETCHCAIADVFLSRLGTVSTWKFGPVYPRKTDCSVHGVHPNSFIISPPPKPPPPCPNTTHPHNPPPSHPTDTPLPPR